MPIPAIANQLFLDGRRLHARRATKARHMGEDISSHHSQYHVMFEVVNALFLDLKIFSILGRSKIESIPCLR
jgi:hypothetical protein